MVRRRKLYHSTIKQNQKFISKNKLTIGIVSTSKGAGATHLTMAMATYLDRNRIRTAVVEKQQTSTFKSIEKSYEGMFFNQDNTSFQIKKRTFFPCCTNPISDIKNMAFQVIVIDYGSAFFQFYQEFENLDIKLVIGHGSEWKMEEFGPIVQEDKYKNYRYIVNFGSKEETNWFKRIYGRKAVPMPFIKDPFVWSGDMETFLNPILM